MNLKRVLLAAAAALSIAAPAAGTTVVTADRLLDVRTGRYVEHPAIVIDDAGRITAVTDARTIRCERRGQAYRVARCDVAAGADRHARASDERSPFSVVTGVTNSLIRSGSSSGRAEREDATVEAGFTTVRNVGTSDYADVGLKQAIELGSNVPGPRIVPATGTRDRRHRRALRFPRKGSRRTIETSRTEGVFLCRWGGRHPRRRFERTVNTARRSSSSAPPAACCRRVTRVGGQQLRPMAEMTALVNEAHMPGSARRRARARPPRVSKTQSARAPTRSSTVSLADAEAFLQLPKSHGTYFFNMDIYNDDYIIAERRERCCSRKSLDKERAIGRKQRETFQAAVKAGVKMIYGTDAGVYPHGDNAEASLQRWWNGA